MTPESFAAFIARMGWTDTRAARELGCGRNSISNWTRPGARVPRYIALACQALANGLPPMA